jgi:membrane protein DedA with SNARE-associated domain
VLVASITSSITSFVGNHGIYAIFVLMAIDAVFPAASELVMIYGGALAAGAVSGHLSLFGRIHSAAAGYVAVAVAGTLGYLVGALVGWFVGAAGGRPLLERRGRALHLTPEKLDRAERWFDRWDVWAVFVGRLTPVVRSFISIPAGVFRTPLGLYTALTLAGSAIWCFALAGVGWGVGSSYKRFDHGFRYAEYAVVALVVVAFAYWVVKRYRTRLTPSADDPAH